MKIYNYLLCLIVFVSTKTIIAQDIGNVRGLAIAAPSKVDLPLFINFINDELIPRKINTLLLRVDHNFQYKSHPELVNDGALDLSDVTQIVEACKNANIKIIPQINLLGHQSWHSKASKLLSVYPEFDETPHVILPEKYEWPNADGLYCKSYCPLHPDVHNIVFALMDEICDAFQSNAFHAGMDEVFYIGDDKCPRCSGKDKAELFAHEVSLIRNHLALKNRILWIWGDRLIDGRTTGIGMWEASMNQTHRAIDMIPKDIVICDWHYERPDPTAAYFALKGFEVITCPWRTADIALQQQNQLSVLRQGLTKIAQLKINGMMQTVWRDAGSFIRNLDSPVEDPAKSDTACFKAIFPK